MRSERRNVLIISYCFVHAFVHGRIKLWHIVYCFYWLKIGIWFVTRLEARVDSSMICA
jgi:hypothetical protein